MRPTNWKRVGTSLAAAATLAVAGLGNPLAAEAHGHGGAHGGGGFVVRGGFYGFAPGWGYGFGYGFGPWAFGFYPPAFYQPQGGIDLGVALMAGYGAVNMNVKPNQAEVWVDGKFIAEARDLDGYPSYLWLKAGPHHVVVYKGGYARFEEDVEVDPGMKKDLKIRMEQGDSQPPGTRPGAVKVK